MNTADPAYLERAREVLLEEERDKFGILRFRTPSRRVAIEVESIMRDGGYGVVVMSPSETWHKQWAVSCWGDYKMTSDGPVPIR